MNFVVRSGQLSRCHQSKHFMFMCLILFLIKTRIPRNLNYSSAMSLILAGVSLHLKTKAPGRESLGKTLESLGMPRTEK